MSTVGYQRRLDNLGSTFLMLAVALGTLSSYALHTMVRRRPIDLARHLPCRLTAWSDVNHSASLDKFGGG